MNRNYPNNPFERYADDAIVHCKTNEEAVMLLEKIKQRLKECRLEMHPTKTKIVYCKDDARGEEFETAAFDFLGYTFRPRKVATKQRTFTGFNPGVSNKAKKKMNETIRGWRLHMLVNKEIDEIAKEINPVINGWMNYYGRFHKSALQPIVRHINESLTRWVKKKYKRFVGSFKSAINWLGGIAKRNPELFGHWKMQKPPT